jgi:hypothetical protein
MKYFGSLGTFIILMSSLLLLTKAWSSEIVSKQLVPGNLRGVEAIVIKVDQESLTLRPTTGNSSEFSFPRKDDGTLHIGDKVVLEEKNLRKLGVGSGQVVPSQDVKEGQGEGNVPLQPSAPAGSQPDRSENP